MRPVVALVLVAIVAFTVGATIAFTLGRNGAFVAALMLSTVALSGAAILANDVLERRREAAQRLRFRRSAPVVDVAAMPRRIRQGRP